jgi:hypothetical protein
MLLDKRNKNNLITNKEYEHRIKTIDIELNKDHSKTIYIKLEYAKKSILDTLFQREINNIII